MTTKMILLKNVLAYIYLIVGLFSIIFSIVETTPIFTFEFIEYAALIVFCVVIFAQYVILNHTIIKYVVPFKILILFDVLSALSIVGTVIYRL